MQQTIPQKPVKLEQELRDAFWEKVKGIPNGEKLVECIQCGTCSGTCPVAYMMDITPRQIVGLFRAGHLEEILNSRSIWICASCYSCRVRCPSGILVTDMMYALKQIAMKAKIYPKNFPVYALSSSFIDYVYKYGRNFEFGLVIRYFSKAGITKLAKNGNMGMKMLRTKRMSLTPTKIKRVNEVRAIIDHAQKILAEEK